MIAVSSVTFLLGPILLGLAALMLVPCLIAWQTGSPDLKPFLISEAATVAAAIALLVFRRRARLDLRVREMFLLTNMAWLMVGAFGALRRLELKGTETLAVFGQGPVGLSATMLGAAMGARVIALDVEPGAVTDEVAAHLAAGDVAKAEEVFRALSDGDERAAAFPVGAASAISSEGSSARSRASIRTTAVVLPVPGGPQRTRLGTTPVSRAVARSVPAPRTPGCPSISSGLRGRMRSASGAGGRPAPAPSVVTASRSRARARR